MKICHSLLLAATTLAVFGVKVEAADSFLVTTIAGNGTQGFAGDGGPAISASLDFPDAIAFDALQNLYIADDQNHRIRKIDRDGRITTIWGDGSYLRPTAVAVDAAGSVYFNERWTSTPHRIWKVNTTGE